MPKDVSITDLIAEARLEIAADRKTAKVMRSARARDALEKRAEVTERLADALEAVTVPTENEREVLEWCRQCRDELPHGTKLPPADFILWGKYFPGGALGPKCYACAMQWFDVLRVVQYAVFDLRPIRLPVPVEPENKGESDV